MPAKKGPVTFTLDSRKYEYVDRPISAARSVTKTKSISTREDGQMVSGEGDVR